MKKLLALGLALIMVATMSVVCFAEKGGFVYSPSVNPAPVVVDVEFPEDCPAELVVTPYVERDTLDDDALKDIQDAYEEIVNLEEDDDLYKSFEELAEELGIPVELLLISDLFDIDYTDCGEHDEHVPYSVKLSSDTFKNFVQLVHYKDGEWIPIPGATIDENNVLSFTYDDYGAFAVIVTSKGSPETGDNGIFIFCIVMMIVSAAGLVTIYAVSRRKSAAQSK